MSIKSLFSLLRGAALLLTVFFTLAGQQEAFAQDGAAIFNANCVSCHKINDRLVGPALRDAHTRWPDEAKLISWIRNSQKYIKEHPEDKYAQDLYKEYNGTLMTAFAELQEAEIKAVIAYIKDESAKPAPGAAVAGAPAAAPKSDAPIFLYILAIALAVGVVLMVAKLFQNYFKIRGVRLLNWNDINGVLSLVFMLGFFWFVLYQIQTYGSKLLPEAASEHGVITDQMMWVTFGLTFFVFITTHMVMFWYAYKYRAKEGARGYFYPDNKKLEFFWTLIPAVVLTGLILYGSRVWLRITTQEKPKGVNTIELFAKQFEWRARYSGADNKLGKFNYRLIGSDVVEEGELKGQQQNLIGLDPKDVNSSDDVVLKEMHIPVNEPILFKFRAQDVIHSAYLPFFRVQMNVVPGMPTEFFWTPTISTSEMRKRLGDPSFNYEMACNKICGASHFNMRLVVVVDDNKADYKRWLTAQKPFLKKAEAMAAEPTTGNASIPSLAKNNR